MMTRASAGFRLWLGRLRRRRSAGQIVSAWVYRRIIDADRARSDGHWDRATTLYGEALSRRPDLAHLRVQRAHALKEGGHWRSAEQEYRLALASGADPHDTTMHLAWLLKQRGALADAAMAYADLVIALPDDVEAMREARELLGHIGWKQRRRLTSALMATLPPAESACSSMRPLFEVSGDIVFDVSDLIRFFSHSRRPTGIQRVQVETLIARARNIDAPVSLCCFIDGRDEWVPVPRSAFLAVATSSLSAEPRLRMWEQARDRLHLELIGAEKLDFSPRSVLIDLGASWALPNYFLRLRHEQMQGHLIYLPFVHDTIPLLFAEFFDPRIVAEFTAWVRNSLRQAAGFLTASQSTKRDLLIASRRMGHELDLTRISVVPLQAGWTQKAPPYPKAATSVWRSPFVLLVATIEPRKGHLIAFQAWAQLLEKLGSDHVPDLVCVGRNGWRNASIFARAQDPALSRKVTFLSGLSDETLASYYRDCLFTLFPSFYEGWGLPVTEALCHGKVVITTTSSSLPEAGREFAIYVPPGDADALAKAAETLIVDPAIRTSLEKRIVDEFRPVTWNEVGDDIIGLAASLRLSSSRDLAPIRPPLLSDSRPRFLSLLGERRPADQMGEPFRAGLGWYGPDQWGSRVRRQGELSFAVDRTIALPGEEVTVSLCLFGAMSKRRLYRISGGETSVEGHLNPGERKAVSLALMLPPDGMVTIVVSDWEKDALTNPDQDGDSELDAIGVEYFAVASRTSPAAAEAPDARIAQEEQA